MCFGCCAKGRKPCSSCWRESRLVSLFETWQSFICKHLCCWNTSFHSFSFGTIPSLLLCSNPTWADLHGFSVVGTIIWTVLCGLMWNDWGVQVYLSFPARFTFFLSSLLSVCSFILGCLLYFSYYLRDNCCNAYIVWSPTGWEINTCCQPNTVSFLLSSVKFKNPMIWLTDDSIKERWTIKNENKLINDGKSQTSCLILYNFIHLSNIIIRCTKF